MTSEQVSGFRQLLAEAASATDIPSFSCVVLEEHPFRLSFPGSLHYVDGGSQEGARGFIRLTGWTMADQCLGGSVPVTFLRVIHADTETEGEHRLYYEATVGTRYHYMVGECTDCSGGGRIGKRMLDNYFAFLSSMYGIELKHADIEFPRSEDIYRGRLRSMIEAAKQKNRRARKDYEAQVRRHPSFWAGDTVWFTGEYLSRHGRVENKSYRVLRVEKIPNHCSCGLGDNPGTQISVHPVCKCNLRRRFDAEHCQLVTLDFGHGRTETVTGYYLVRHFPACG